MPETSGINAGGGIKNVGSDSSSSRQYEFVHYTKKQNVFKLHVGELVQGTVMGIPKEGEAIVRLPIGTINAELNGQLKKGDTLFFRVESVEPGLVLKIHSISTVVNGKELDANEILRVLDLPANQIFLEITLFLKNNKPIIVRNEALLYHSNLNSIDDSIYKNNSHEALLKTLQFFYQCNLKFNLNIFNKLLPVFLGAKYFEMKLRELEKQIHYLNVELQDQFINFYGNLISSDIKKNFSIFINLTKPKEFKEDSFYIFLFKILTEIEKKNIDDNTKIKNAIHDILNILEGQFLQNILSEKMQLNSLIFIPIFNNNQIRIVQLMMLNQKDIDLNSENIKMFSFVIDTELAGKIKSKGFINSGNLELELITENKEFQKHIEKSIIELKQKLKNDNYIVKSLKIIDISEEDIATIQEEQINKSSSFSVVI